MADISKVEYEALLTFRATLRKFQHFSEEGARAAGITPQQHQALLAIKGQPGREWANVSEIAEALQITHHAAVGLMDRCQSAELIVREQDPHDRRQVHCLLTARGEEILERLSARNLAELKSLRSSLRVPELKSKPSAEAARSTSKKRGLPRYV